MDSTGENQQEQDFYQPIPPEPNALGITDQAISWTASEFIHHTKDASWYVPALMVVAILAGLGYLLSRDFFTPAAVIVLGAIMLLISNRKPRTLTYLVDAHGIKIGNRELSYDDFQSFAIIQEDSVESILLVPQKRWSPALSLYFSPDDGQKIFDMLSNFLPFEEREKDLIDKFLHKIRF